MRQIADGNLDAGPAAISEGEQSNTLRSVSEAVISLVLAVILFRTFLIEGYMISTGSMAPTLLGFHKQVDCPACGHRFPLGVAFDEPDGRAAASAPQSRYEASVVCPNCGRRGIDARPVPRNQGDQLLVHKSAYQFQRARRWEVVVFRNPYRATQAYVKRIAGLPGETIAIRDGDVYVDGTLARKSLATQRAMRILVYDHDCEPPIDADWQPRWVPDEGEPGWRRSGQAFTIEDSLGDEPVPGASLAGGAIDANPVPPQKRWVTYRHWIPAGGFHQTSVPVSPSAAPIVVPPGLGVRFHPESQRLSCTGVLDADARDRLLAANGDPAAARAIRELQERSHVASVTDEYGYNRSQGSTPRNVVRDLMLEAELTVRGGTGEFSVQMTEGEHVFDLTLDVGAREARLAIDGSEPVRRGPLSQDLASRPVQVEMSIADRQVLVALDGRLAFAPWGMPSRRPAGSAPRRPVRFGAEGLSARVASLKLFRDVHYTQRDGARPFRLGEDEYFVLGDNSPVSHDSRRWPEGAVSGDLFLGKPFVVHLPSRQVAVRFGGARRFVRVPDFGRVRSIR